MSNVREITLEANMGSCQCGDVYCKVQIDDEKKEIITTNHDGYRWKAGYLRSDGTFHVPYAGSINGLSGYKHIIK
jgi:hypothetical protein